MSALKTSPASKRAVEVPKQNVYPRTVAGKKGRGTAEGKPGQQDAISWSVKTHLDPSGSKRNNVYHNVTLMYTIKVQYGVW